MSYSQEIIDYLTPLVMQFGDVNRVNALPLETVMQALAHPDDLIAVEREIYRITLTGLVGGYRVIDPDYTVRYEVGAPVDGEFGQDPRDLAFLKTLKDGDWFYLAYDMADAEEPDGLQPRLIMVIKG